MRFHVGERTGLLALSVAGQPTNSTPSRNQPVR
jgi:hypothetical protein